MSHLPRRVFGGLLLVMLSAGAVFFITGRTGDRPESANAPAVPSAPAPLKRPRGERPTASPVATTAANEPTAISLRATISGRVVDHETGTPVPGVRVYFGGGKRATTTDAGGTFALQDLPSGKSVRLRVEKEGEYLADVIDVQVPVGATAAQAETSRLVRGNWATKFGGGPAGLAGINHELRAGKVYVTEVRVGTPADQAGIRAGDRLVSVDGKSVDGLGHRARSFLIMGKPGTDLALVLESPTGNTRTVTIKRYAGEGQPGYPFAERRM
jgi:membrane-associated protease RseP (regulator of RpoE activity)